MLTIITLSAQPYSPKNVQSLKSNILKSMGCGRANFVPRDLVLQLHNQMGPRLAESGTPTRSNMGLELKSLIPSIEVPCETIC